MLDINKIRNNTEEIRQSLLKRMDPRELNLETIITLDDKRRETIAKVDNIKAQQNKLAKGGSSAAALTKDSKPTPEQIEHGKQLREQVKKLEVELDEITTKLNTKLGNLPNIVADDVMSGNKENNKVVRTYGNKPKFKFQPKDHMELAKIHDLIEIGRAHV